MGSSKEYIEANKEHIVNYMREYRKDPKHKKAHRISNWKWQGMVCDDWDKMYEDYINMPNCEECGIELVSGRSRNARCLDHDHETGQIRNILCYACNSRRK